MKKEIATKKLPCRSFGEACTTSSTSDMASVFYHSRSALRLLRTQSAPLSSGHRPLCTAPKKPAGPKKDAEQPEHRPYVPTSTSMFRFTNPELYMDPQKASTWKLIGGLWIVFGGIAAYGFCTDDPIERARLLEEKRRQRPRQF